MIGSLIQKSSQNVKEIIEDLLNGKSFRTRIGEQIVYQQLDYDETAIFSLLLASGYLKILASDYDGELGEFSYELGLTNKEVSIMFRRMVEEWFRKRSPAYNRFVKALLSGDLKSMNAYMNQVALQTFSYFDSGTKPSEVSEPEKFYHGFVLGLLVELSDRYTLSSNRESGLGRYDVMLEPKRDGLDAMILEFKVFDSGEEGDLTDTVKAALLQIQEKQYAQALIAKGIPESRIRAYGFAFRGKTVLIGKMTERNHINDSSRLPEEL